jgi:aryl-alcohol dehydrogenase-like predicted oxidoreductase
MKYRQVGKTGLRVSKLCLGALTFGRETTEEGGNFVDSADGLIIASKIS